MAVMLTVPAAGVEGSHTALAHEPTVGSGLWPLAIQILLTDACRSVTAEEVMRLGRSRYTETEEAMLCKRTRTTSTFSSLEAETRRFVIGHQKYGGKPMVNPTNGEQNK